MNDVAQELAQRIAQESAVLRADMGRILYPYGRQAACRLFENGVWGFRAHLDERGELAYTKIMSHEVYAAPEE